MLKQLIDFRVKIINISR